MAKYRRITFAERIKISVYLSERFSISEIARRLGRNKSSVSREIARCRETPHYDAPAANSESKYFAASRRDWFRKLERNFPLLDEVFCGLRERWSPEQISKMLKIKYPNDKAMRISHEAIYTYIYVLPRGELRNELTSYLRRKKKFWFPRSRVNSNRGRLPEMISIEERPKAVEKRSLPGHWEGDLIIGKNHGSALGTLVERKTRALILVPLRGKKRDAVTVRRAFENALKSLPKQMKLSLTYDQGHEMSEHRLFAQNTKMKVYFCHPASPWERGTCENTNGLIRDYFPKKTDFKKISRKEIKRVQNQLNDRPRKALDYYTPREMFDYEVLKALR